MTRATATDKRVRLHELRIVEEAAGTVSVPGAAAEAAGGVGGIELPVWSLRDGLSLNGRRFTQAAVEGMARLVEATRASADHAPPSEHREWPVRSIRDCWISCWPESSSHPSKSDPTTALVDRRTRH